MKWPRTTRARGESATTTRSPRLTRERAARLDREPLHLPPERGRARRPARARRGRGRRRSAPGPPRSRGAPRPPPPRARVRRRAPPPAGRRARRSSWTSAARISRAGRERRGLLDHVLELADVAGPVVLEEARERLRGEDLPVARALVVALQEVGGEERHVLPALAERRDPDRHDGEPVVEVLAEAALRDGAAEVLVRRGDHADVHLDRRWTRPRAGSRPPAARAGASPGSPARSRRSRR